MVKPAAGFPSPRDHRSHRLNFCPTLIFTDMTDGFNVIMYVPAHRTVQTVTEKDCGYSDRTCDWAAPQKQHRFTAQQRMSGQPNVLSLKPVSIKLTLDRSPQSWLMAPSLSFPSTLSVHAPFRRSKERQTNKTTTATMYKGAINRVYLWKNKTFRQPLTPTHTSRPPCDNSFTLLSCVMGYC